MEKSKVPYHRGESRIEHFRKEKKADSYFSAAKVIREIHTDFRVESLNNVPTPTAKP